MRNIDFLFAAVQKERVALLERPKIDLTVFFVLRKKNVKRTYIFFPKTTLCMVLFSYAYPIRIRGGGLDLFIRLTSEGLARNIPPALLGVPRN